MSGRKKNQNALDIPFFEYSDSTYGCGEQESMPSGAVLVVTRDNLQIWDIEAGKTIGKLAARQLVETSGDAVSTEVYGKRFDPIDDKLYTKAEFLNTYAGQHELPNLERYW